jgi:prefoldin subunit 5
MRDFGELNQQVNEVKRMLNRFIQKLTAQVEMLQPLHSSLKKL